MLKQDTNTVLKARGLVGTPSHTDMLGKDGNTCWLKADVGVYSNDNPIVDAVDGATVKYWGCQSPINSFGYQLTLANRPIFKTNQINGLPCISCTMTSNQYLYIPDNQSLAFNVYNQTIFVVGKWYAGSGFIGKGSNDADVKGQSGGNSITHRKMQIYPYGGQLVSYWSGTDSNGANAGIIPSGRARTDWNVYSATTLRNNLIRHNINGLITNNTQTVNIDQFNTKVLGIGACFAYAGIELTTCDVAEICIFNYALPQWKHDIIMKYLLDKYNIPAAVTIPTYQGANRSLAGTRNLA